MLKTAPAVFGVEDHYEIMVPVKHECLLWVRVGEKNYYDASCGVMNSLHRIHRVRVPMEALHAYKVYTVCWKRVLRRKPYYTETTATKEKTYPFYPVPEENIRAYHISDAHNHVNGPVKAAEAFGKIHFLILNGDLLDYVSHPRKFENIYKLCDRITGGQIPVVFARGNHDMRGKYAERFADYTPNQAGKTYYTFRLGSVWGMVLDCGEDKADTSAGYGHTIACHDYRLEQSRFLRKVAEEGAWLDNTIKTRLIICHIPFTQKDAPPFDIEQALYSEWTKQAGKMQPHLIICGHTHQEEVRLPGCAADHYGQPCPVVIASGFDDKKHWTGCGFCFGPEKTELTFTDSSGNVVFKTVISRLL